jgi:hypothetical protein
VASIGKDLPKFRSTTILFIKRQLCGEECAEGRKQVVRENLNNKNNVYTRLFGDFTNFLLSSFSFGDLIYSIA